MGSNQVIFVIAAFIVGVMAGILLSTVDESILGMVVLDSKGLEDISLPSDHLNESSFLLYGDKLIIRINNASIASYEDTGSMIPFLSNTSNGIVIKPSSEGDIHVGDIISFMQDGQFIVHRVMSIDSDEQGVYYITRGDNVNAAYEIVRFRDVEYKLVGIIY